MTRAEAADVLRVRVDATPAMVDAAFRAAAVRGHPDRGGARGTFEAAVEARAVLRQPAPSAARRARPVVGATASALRRRRWDRARRRWTARVRRASGRVA